MMKKRGVMISLMIIIGLLILALFLVTYAMRAQLTDLIKPGVSDVSGVQVYVENCIDGVSKYALYKIGKQGGSLFLQEEHFSNPFLDVNYDFYNANTFPSIDDVKTEMEAFIDSNLKNCTSGFGGFASQGMKIKEGEVKTNVLFSQRAVLVTVDYPLEISYSGSTFSLDKFQQDIPLGFKKIHSETDKFLSGIESTKNGYDLLYLNSLNANVYITPEEDTDLFVEERLDSRLNSDNYIFIFAVK